MSTTRHRMRWRRFVAPVTFTLAISGCAALRGRAPEREAAVDLRVSRSEAIRRTLATFREQGYHVRETTTSGANPETEEFRHDGVDAVFRATITGSATSSRVVFSGTYRRRQLGGLMHGDDRVVQNSDDPVEKELWARLSNLAIMLRQANR